jgi:hypothetical protein
METQKNINEPNAPGASKGRKQSGAAKAPTSNQGTPQAGAQGQSATPAQKAPTENAGGEKNLLQQAKQTSGEIVNQVQQRAGSQLNRQMDTAASDLSTLVNAVRRFGESLTGEENGPIARYAAQYGDKAANNLERLSNYIREQDPKQLLEDVQDFGRRRPAWLLGGAFLLGFAGARMIKSSMEAGAANVPATRPSPTPNAR